MRIGALIFGIVAVVACGALPAFAQSMQGSGPAGNTHPQTDAVHVMSGEATNPFGIWAEAPKPPVDQAQQMQWLYARIIAKRDFARAVDLSPLRGLAVQHGSRVKALDTLARETVSTITGRRDYVDYDYTIDPTDPKKIKFNQVFTFMDMMIDPAFYVNRPLVGVTFLPLREKILEGSLPDEQEIERWKKVGRVSPAMLDQTWEPIVTKYGSDQAYNTGLEEVHLGWGMYVNGWKNLLMVAPDAKDKEWIHIGQLAPTHPVRIATQAIADGWRAGDVEATNIAIAMFAEQLKAIHPTMHPEGRIGIELTYNSVQPFKKGYWIYFLSLVTLLIAFGTGRKGIAMVGVALLLAAIALHGGGFAARCLIAERFAIQNQFESMMGLSLFATLVGLGLMLAMRQYLFGAASAGVGFMMLLAAQAKVPGVTIEKEAAILNTSWLLEYHVTTVLASYGLISLGLMCSIFYLVVYYTKGRVGGAMGVAVGTDAPKPDAQANAAKPGIKRLLHDLDKSQMIVLQLAFWVLGVGILLGAWWADHSWGRWWAFDPKELWALITWVVYLVVIHLRFGITGPKRALTTAWLSVLGFIVMLWCYFGVNLLLPGLHAYA